MCLCITMCMSSEARSRTSCSGKLNDVGSRNQILVLWKSLNC